MGRFIEILVLLVTITSSYSMGVKVKNKSGRKTLKMVHLLYRHGARSPTHFYPTNPHIKDWLDGPGRLTQIGMQEEYQLGKFLKERYMINTTLINQMYLHNEIYILSSDSERCLQSAETQLAGFYPPMGRQVWNKEIPWQPIPVHTVPGSQDPLLRPDDTYCPRLDELWDEKKSQPIYKEKIKENQELLDYLSKYSGMDVTFDNIDSISDSYLCEKQQGFTTPQWLLNRLNETLDISSWIFLNQYKGSDELGRLLGGSLLNVINSNMEAMSKHQPLLYKMIILSGHDTSILALSTALNIEMSVPTFASCVMVELYEDESNSYYVEMQYRNDSSGRLYPLHLTDCSFSCPLDDFIELTKNRVTADQAAECKKTSGEDTYISSSKGIMLSCIFAGVVVFALLFYALYVFYKDGKKISCSKKDHINPIFF